MNIHISHGLHRLLRLLDIFLGREMVVVRAESHDVSVASRRGSIGDGVHEFIVRVRDASPRPQLWVAHFGVDFCALVHVADFGGFSLSRD